MHVLHANSEEDAELVNKMIGQDKDVFILVYMEGCGPCNATRPEWSKLESALTDQYANNDNLAIIDLNKDYQDTVSSHLGDINGYPTMKYINKKGSMKESYEDSSIKSKDRSVDSFIAWIESKINKLQSTTPTSSSSHVFKRLKQTKKRSSKKHMTRKSLKDKLSKKGGKWSQKYKKIINCNRPKGFSQRQYCKYGRKNN
jgi:hypothetical protein